MRENDMYIVAGSAMVALGLIGVSLLAWLFRRLGMPRWLNSDLAAMLLCIPVTALMGVGGGYILIGLSHGVGVVQVAALIGCAAVLWGVRWVLRRHLPAPVVVGTAGVGLTAKPPRAP
jgi:TctA family transporter